MSTVTFGSNYNYASNNGPMTITNTTSFVNGPILSFNVPSNGTYRFEYSVEHAGTFWIGLLNILVLLDGSNRLTDTNTTSDDSTSFATFTGWKDVPLTAGTHAVKMAFKTTATSSPFPTTANMRLAVYQVA